MKTATVTWITYNNYGTQLQAYALQNFIKTHGYDNEIIYDEAILEKQRKKSSVNSVQKQSTPKTVAPQIIKPVRKDGLVTYQIKRIVDKAITAYINFNKKHAEKVYYTSQKIIEKFKRKRLAINYDINPNALSALEVNYDVFICGSDQIWSPLDINLNGYYFLDFTNKTKMSYAASIGTEAISSEKAGMIKNWLKDYRFISVRESQSASQLSALTNKQIEFVCDPTLLLDKDSWSEFCKKGITLRKKYLLCYFLEDRKWYFDFVQKIAKQLDLSPVLIPSRKDYASKKFCLHSAVSPVDFVSLFKNAEFVLTDSYHGSIFSIIFSKQFLCIKRFDDFASDNQNIRIFSLFKLLKIEDIIVDSSDCNIKDINIDYQKVQSILNDFRKKSEKFLLNSLNEISGQLSD